MHYLFILGNNPALSIAEIEAVLFPKQSELYNNQVLRVELLSEINPTRLIQQLGGTIKIARVLKTIKINEQEKIAEYSQEFFQKKYKFLQIEQQKQGLIDKIKFNFAFSDYGTVNIPTKKIGMELKKYFKSKNIPSRLVVSQNKFLSSVIVEQNKLLKRGLEVLIVNDEQEIILGETLAVQDFKNLSKRDYGRPVHDAHSGMIPPKLAQIMLNLAQIEKKDLPLLDPFCGSGTILNEAILLGHKNIIGTDISPQAINNTKINISWLKNLYQLESIKMRFAVRNVRDLNKIIKTNSVARIVTEPYLGPQRGHHDLSLVLPELIDLYTQTLEVLFNILQTGGRVVMIWPVFKGKFIEPQLNPAWRQLRALPDKYLSLTSIKKDINFRQNIVYGRDGQKVFREIVILEKN